MIFYLYFINCRLPGFTGPQDSTVDKPKFGKIGIVGNIDGWGNSKYPRAYGYQ